MEMNHQRWVATNAYAREVFGVEDEALARLRTKAESAGLPGWAVSSDVGRLLMILARTTEGRRALEIGTLGGYSTVWITRGLRPEGVITTIEYDDRHADFAEAMFADLGLADRISLRRGPALDVLPELAGELGPESVDLVFVDADKEAYPDYWRLTSDLVVPGGLLLVDNIFGTGASWIDDLSDPSSAATDRMNRTAAADDRFETAGVFVRSGLLVARRRGLNDG